MGRTSRVVLPDPDYPRPANRPDGRPYWRKETPYPTDELIQSLSDEMLLEHMGVPRRFHHHAISMYDKPMQPEIEKWIANLPYIFRPHGKYQKEKPDLGGVGLALHGPSGTRKTTTAAALLLRLVRMGVPNTDPTGRNFTWHGWAMGRFVDWQVASALFREAVKDEVAEQQAQEIRQAMTMEAHVTKHGDFLVIDDISRERRTEFNVGELQRTLRVRHNYCYPTIITTNHAPKVWADVYDDVFATFAKRALIPVEMT